MDDENKDSARGAQLLLSGTILKGYCAVSEEDDDEDEDGVDAIDVRRAIPLALALIHTFYQTTGRCKRGYPAVPR